METTYYIETLKQKLEQSIAPQKISIRSSEFLSGVIFGSIHESISSSTLQRFFGLVSNRSQISDRSLDTICRFLGYENWNSFCTDEEVNSLKKNEKVVTDNMGLMLFEMALKHHNFNTVIDYIRLLRRGNEKQTLSEVDKMLANVFKRDNIAKEELLSRLKDLRGIKKLLPNIFLN